MTLVIRKDLDVKKYNNKWSSRVERTDITRPTNMAINYGPDR